MEHSITNVCESNNRLLLLREEQVKFTEGSKKWLSLQTLINQIIAQNYLHYVNR
jgi:hypothetical protein